MPTFAVTAIGADRPGIVAAVTRVLVERGANLEDCSMSILGGQFAMVMMVAAPEDDGAGRLEAALAAGVADLDLVVSVRELTAGAAVESPGAPYTVVVYGADKPGIVHRVTAALAVLRVNIVDLTTRVTGEAPAVYTMVIEVTVPDALDPEVLGDRLAEVAAELGVEVALHPSDADIF